MPVPTKAEFHLLVELLTPIERPELEKQAIEIARHFDHHKAVQTTLLNDFIDACVEKQKAEQMAARTSKAGIWLFDQEVFNNAVERLIPRTQKKGRSQQDTAHFAKAFQADLLAPPPPFATFLKQTQRSTIHNKKQIREIYNTRFSQLGRSIHVRNSLHSQIHAQESKVIAGIVTAISDYHYESAERAKIISKLPALLDRTVKACAEYAEVTKQINAVRDAIDSRWLQGFQSAQRIREAGERLKKSKNTVLSQVPFERNDETVCERLFVLAVARHFRKTLGSNKPSVIADLMYLKGFKTRLSARTVERTLKRRIPTRRK